MPVITIQISRPGLSAGQPNATRRQKAALIKGVSDLVRDVFNNPAAHTFIVVEEVDVEDWEAGDPPIAHYRRQRRWPPSGEQAS